MALGSVALDDFAQPAGMAGVYLLPREEFDWDSGPPTIDERPVTAVAPHPDADDLLYLTTEHPETLAFLPDPVVELRI